jgi:hypothetical protein
MKSYFTIELEPGKFKYRWMVVAKKYEFVVCLPSRKKAAALCRKLNEVMNQTIEVWNKEDHEIPIQEPQLDR